MTSLRHPPLPDPSQASLSPLAQVRGRGRNCVGIQGPCLFLLPFLGAAWAKPTKERDREGGESERKGGCPLSLSSRQSSPTAALTHHFPRGLVVSPTQAKWNHSMEHWERKRMEEAELRDQGGAEERRDPHTHPPFPPPHPSGVLPYSIPWENS